MMRSIITDFENILKEVLDNTESLFQEWESTDRGLRCVKALTVLMRVVEVTNKFEVLSHHIKECFPPVALINYDDWCKSIDKTKNAIQSVVKSYKFVEQVDSTDFNDYLKEMLRLEATDHQTLVALERQLTNGEKTLLNTLEMSFDYLLEILNVLQTTLTGDRSDVLAMLYMQAEARYKKNVWEQTERGRYLKHLENTKFPWGYEPTVEQLRKLYGDTFNEFSQTKLGKIYDEFRDDDLVALALGISHAECSTDELNEFFKQTHRLRELKLLAEKKEKGLNIFSDTEVPIVVQEEQIKPVMSSFSSAVIVASKAPQVIILLRQLMESKTKPKDVLMPVRAAMEAAVIRRPTWEEFCQEFGSYRLKSKTSFSDYTNPDNKPYAGADFEMMKDKFRRLVTEGQ